MPKGVKFLPHSELLTTEEIGAICSVLATLGIDEIRVTGGEPTLRPEFDAIMEVLSAIPWRKFALTTNGFMLAEKLPVLEKVGCRSVNVSLDSLDEVRFRAITASPLHRKVVSAILQAKDRGFEVKINAIVFKGINDDELLAFLDFAEKHQVEVRFLELMRVGPSIDSHQDRFIPARDMIARIGKERDLQPLESAPDSTSFSFRTGGGGRIGFIASESQPFCGACSRLRLTATGKLRSCLFSDTGAELRGKDPLDYPEILAEVMAMKPIGRLPRIHQPMNQIGG